MIGFKPPAKKVFISYSHEDHKSLKELQKHLKIFEELGAIDVWDDTKLKEGENWRAKLDAALEEASVAIVLLSSSYLSSDFARRIEFAYFIESVKKRKMEMVPIVLSDCAWDKLDGLADFQVFGKDVAVTELTKPKRAKIWNKIAKRVEEVAEEQRPRMVPITLLTSWAVLSGGAVALAFLINWLLFSFFDINWLTDLHWLKGVVTGGLLGFAQWLLLKQLVGSPFPWIISHSFIWPLFFQGSLGDPLSALMAGGVVGAVQWFWVWRKKATGFLTQYVTTPLLWTVANMLGFWLATRDVSLLNQIGNTGEAAFNAWQGFLFGLRFAIPTSVALLWTIKIVTTEPERASSKSGSNKTVGYVISFTSGVAVTLLIISFLSYLRQGELSDQVESSQDTSKSSARGVASDVGVSIDSTAASPTRAEKR